MIDSSLNQCSPWQIAATDVFALNFEFHFAAVMELLRVAKEVRIFPMLTLERRVSPYVDPLRTELANKGFVSVVQRVSYEFQRGGNEMLRIRATS